MGWCASSNCKKRFVFWYKDRIEPTRYTSFSRLKKKRRAKGEHFFLFLYYREVQFSKISNNISLK